MAGRKIAVELESGFCSLYEFCDGVTVHLSDYVFSSQKVLSQKEALTDFLKSQLKVEELEELVVSWIHPNGMLVPGTIFEVKQKEVLFRSVFEKEIHSSEIDYNRLAEQQMVVIYEIPLWIKSLFVSFFPKTIIQHHYTHAISGLMKQNFRLHVQAEIYPNLCFLEIALNGQLLLANCYEIQTENDVIYYLSFALQQLDLNLTDKWNLYLHKQTLSEISAEHLVRNLKLLDTYKQAEISLSSDRKMKQLLLCV